MARWVDAVFALPRWTKVSLFAGTAVLVFLWSVTATTAIRGSDADADPSVAAPSQRWCGDWNWVYRAAQLYKTSFASAKRPISPVNITASLSAGGGLYVNYRDLVRRGGIPEIDLDELRAYMTQLAEAEAAGTDPLAFAEDIQKNCS